MLMAALPLLKKSVHLVLLQLELLLLLKDYFLEILPLLPVGLDQLRVPALLVDLEVAVGHRVRHAHGRLRKHLRFVEVWLGAEGASS